MQLKMSSVGRDAAGQFIDEYLDTYIALSGQSDARDNLIKEIMAAAASRAALSSEFVPALAVKKRLANALGKHNKAAKAADEEEDEEDEE